MMERFLLLTNSDKDEGLFFANHIKEFLEKRGKDVCIEQISSLDYKNDDLVFSQKKDLDCVLVLGGDGTMLGAARSFSKSEIPLLGVNLGTVGYLTSVNKDNLEASLQKLIDDEYDIEERMMIEGDFISDGEIAGHAIALNDIVVSKEKAFQSLNFDVYVNGQLLTSYVGDGIIISTPTGSTGYNLSAGGPIVEPPAELMVMTPISPHTLNSRSIVLSSKDEVTIKINEGKDGTIQTAVAMADCVDRFDMRSLDCFSLRKSRKCARFIKLNSESFLKVLHDKLQ